MTCDWRLIDMTSQLSRSIARASRAEDRCNRMARLQAMTVAELAEALGGDPASAAPWVQAAAACGIAAAQVQLGRMLLDGAGVPEDKLMALRWFAKAARSSGVESKIRGEAQNMVGRCHELGWGTAIDLIAAGDWYQRAAGLGDSWGMYNLANMLFDGRGVAQDRSAAIAHYERAARLGHARAMNLLGRCLEEGWGAPRDAAAAALWYCRSAEGGYFRGAYNHGIELLRQGRRAAATAMFERACAQADGPLREHIRILAETGHSVVVKQIASNPWAD